jgi:hypothetical protein
MEIETDRGIVFHDVCQVKGPRFTCQLLTQGLFHDYLDYLLLASGK